MNKERKKEREFAKKATEKEACLFEQPIGERKPS